MSHLKVFKCTIYVKTVSGNLKKLEDRRKPIIFIGYEKGSKGFHVYDPAEGKIHLTRDAIFYEEKG